MSSGVRRGTNYRRAEIIWTLWLSFHNIQILTHHSFSYLENVNLSIVVETKPILNQSPTNLKLILPGFGGEGRGETQHRLKVELCIVYINSALNYSKIWLKSALQEDPEKEAKNFRLPDEKCYCLSVTKNETSKKRSRKTKAKKPPHID